MSNNIQTAYESVRKFNTIAGNLSHANHEQTLDGLYSQLEFIESELKETIQAFDEQDTVELVDGACDLFVTVAGFMQRLEAAGVNIEKALARVNENNMTKFPQTFEHNQNPDMQPDGTELVFTDYGHVVYKRHYDSKVMKPTTFVPVDLTSCVPNDIFTDVPTLTEEI